MKKISLFALTTLVVTCSATTPSIPELRMTPTEIKSGEKSESQIGSSKLAGVHTKILAGSPAAAGFLFHFVIRPTTHNDSSSFPS